MLSIGLGRGNGGRAELVGIPFDFAQGGQDQQGSQFRVKIIHHQGTKNTNTLGLKEKAFTAETLRTQRHLV
jgi:hypothetical protein